MYAMQQKLLLIYFGKHIFFQHTVFAPLIIPFKYCYDVIQESIRMYEVYTKNGSREFFNVFLCLDFLIYNTKIYELISTLWHNFGGVKLF